MESSLINMVQTTTGVTLTSQVVEKLNKLFVLALFKNVGSTEFSRSISALLGVTNQVALELRRNLDNDGYIMFHLKPFLFWCFKHRVSKKRKVLECCDSFKVKTTDAALSRLMLDDEVTDKLKPLRKYAALSYNSLRSHVDAMPSKLRSFTRRFVYKKMRFIFENQHYALGVDDLVNDLLTKGIRNVLSTYPRISNELHALNISKRAVKNNGVNLIYYYTSDQRGVVCKSQDGNSFYSKLIPLTDNTEAIIDTLICPTATNIDANLTTDQWITCRQVVSSFKSEKKRCVVTALLGMNDPRFTEWLKTRARPSHRIPNDDLYEVLHHRSNMHMYLEYLAQFAQVPQTKIVKVGKQAAKLIRA